MLTPSQLIAAAMLQNGEEAVLQSLAAKGLIELPDSITPSIISADAAQKLAQQFNSGNPHDWDLEQKQHIAGTESAQSATESVATFTHVYRSLAHDIESDCNIGWFCHSHETALQISIAYFDQQNIVLFGFEPREVGSQICTRLSKPANAADLIEAARHMLDAAHYLQQQAAMKAAAQEAAAQEVAA